jgi:hypothetical protein
MKNHNHLKHLPRVAILMGMLTLAGCVIEPPTTLYTGYPSRSKIPLKVALNITDELCESKDTSKTIAIGAAVASNACVLARSTFTDVMEITNGKPVPSMVDAILTTKVAYFNRTTGASASGEFIIAIKLEWTLSKPDGNIIWVDTISAQGSGSGHTSPNGMLQNALFLELSKSQSTMYSSRAIRQFTKRKYPDVAIADPPLPIGVITDPKVMKLCAALGSSDRGKVQNALTSLRKPEYSAAVPEILPLLLNADDHVIRDACRTLAVIANKDVIPYIEPLLKDKRSAVRKDAQKAIDKLRAKL